MELIQETFSTAIVAPQPEIWTSRVQKGLFANLSHRVVTAKGNAKTMDIFSPINLEKIGEIPLCAAADVSEALYRARVAQESWSARSVKERVAVLRRFHDLILDRQDELLDIMQIETGKARLHGFEEVIDTALNARYYANVAENALSPTSRNGVFPVLTDVTEYHHPVGVVGMIAPWNYPLTLAMSDAIPALVAGNAVILKPAEQTSFTALRGMELFIEAGLPTDIFQIITGTGQDIGTPLIEGVDFVQFTGSTKTGRTVAEQAGRHLLKCSMELGGKNPMIVLHDANLAASVDGAVRGSFTNSGQLCISFERIFVHKSLYDSFLTRFVQATQALKLGVNFSNETQMGSLISKMQLDKVKAHVEDAVSKGAKVLTGGKHRPDISPYFFEPSILTNVTPDMALFSEETFGPVVAVYPFSDIEEALRLANDTEYGLNASVWSNSISEARKVARRIKSGMVNINESYASAFGSTDAPMGGMKASGIGRRHGVEGLLKYTESQTVAVQHVHPIAKPDALSPDQYADWMTKAVRLMKWIPFIK